MAAHAPAGGKQDQPDAARAEILSLAGRGLSNAEIAEQLCLSPHTIKSHIHNLLRKIGASNRAEAAYLLRSHLDWDKSCSV